MTETQLDTFPKLLRDRAVTFADRPAIREKEYGIWQSWTWAQYRDEVNAFANGLASRGFTNEDKLMIIGSNRPRLYWAMAAAQALGGVPIPTYADSVAEEMQYVIEHAEASIIVCADQEQVDKVLEVIDRCPTVRLIIYDDSRGLRDYDQKQIVSFDAVQEEGREFGKSNPRHVEDSIDRGVGDDTCVMLYTSGTTGRPKGVVLSHTNVLSNASAMAKFEGLNETDSVVAYLPMAWIVDYFISYAQQHITGYCVCCPEGMDTFEQDKREIGPTYHFTSPRVLEDSRTQLMIRMEDAGGIKRRMFQYFMNVAERSGVAIQEGDSVSFTDRLMYRIGNLFVYGPLKNTLGATRTRLTYTAGEAIGPDMFNFYRGLGIHLKQVYGQTEASPFVTVQPNDQIRSDTVGIPVEGVEVKLGDGGEVLYRGPGVFKEYYKNPEATESTKSADGWVATGDTGIIDREGHLKIIDRTKDVGRMSDGSMFAPKYVENKLKFFPEIMEAVSFGDGREHAAAFINIDLGAVGDWAERRGLSYSSYQELASHPDVYERIRNCVRQVNEDLAEDELLSSSQIKRFLVLHKELDADDGELTRTRKVRRRIISERYEPLISALYSDTAECHIETEVTFEDGRKGTIAGDIRIDDVETFAPMAKAG